MAPGARKAIISIISSLSFIAVLALGAILTGHSIYEVKTSSMGTAAPVGSLIITHPENEYYKDGIITFKPENSKSYYTHRINGVKDGKYYQTKGDANGATDPWTIEKHNIKGSVKVIIPAGGYAIRMFLIFSLFTIMAILSTRYVTKKWQRSYLLVGTSLAFSITSFVIRPWSGVAMLRNYQIGNSMEASIVSTGILPIKVKSNITSIMLKYGEHGTVTGTPEDSSGVILFTPELSLSFWQWVTLISFCCIPLIISLFWAYSSDKKEINNEEVETSKKVSHYRLHKGYMIAAPITLVIIILSIVMTTQSALVAKITNVANTAKMQDYWTCNGAALSEGPNAIIVWPLNETSETRKIQDLTPEHDNGTYLEPKTIVTNTGCLNDTHNAASFDGSKSGGYSNFDYSLSDTFTNEVWIQTTSKKGGRIMGFSNNKIMYSSEFYYDRILYIDSKGSIGLYVEPTDKKDSVNIRSDQGFNDGNWHHIVGTLGKHGQKLYIDGKLVAHNPNTRVRTDYLGYLKIGHGNKKNIKVTSGASISDSYKGNMQWVTYYNRELTAKDVANHYNLVK